MGDHVILGEARGEKGAIKVAWTVDDPPGPNERAAAAAEVTGFYRRLYGEWAEHPRIITRDETNRERKTFP